MLNLKELIDAVSAQVKKIEDSGGDELGYTQKFGVEGKALYAQDVDRLRVLRESLADEQMDEVQSGLLTD